MESLSLVFSELKIDEKKKKSHSRQSALSTSDASKRAPSLLLVSSRPKMQAPLDLPAAQQAELMERIDAMQVRDR